ncbi:uncharacterized protein LOC127008261 [Eriocheir sinensis]|uniref:uncharacterized protein LOC127008261 n=1 Tax=Eriocheir sinensis TaxID=95602 RepID=UPI0021C77F3D|nr:uncharacterized protein LOC127008261 [Eriocheir sinensis]XP_050735991.1 uncharacterized protein LOC127008261 [Eriocheir sinensis]
MSGRVCSSWPAWWWWWWRAWWWYGVVVVVVVVLAEDVPTTTTTTDITPPDDLIVIILHGFRGDSQKQLLEGDDFPGFARLRADGVVARYLPPLPPPPSDAAPHHHPHLPPGAPLLAGLYMEKTNRSENITNSTLKSLSMDVPRKKTRLSWWTKVEPLWVTAALHNLTSALFNYYRCEPPWVSRGVYCVPAPPAPPPGPRSLTPHLHHALDLLDGGGYTLALVWAGGGGGRRVGIGGGGGGRGGGGVMGLLVGEEEEDEEEKESAWWRAVDVAMLDLHHTMTAHQSANTTNIIVISSPLEMTSPAHLSTHSPVDRTPEEGSHGTVYALGPMFRKGARAGDVRPGDIYRLLRHALHLPPAPPGPSNYTGASLQDFLLPPAASCGGRGGGGVWSGVVVGLWCWWWCWC